MGHSVVNKNIKLPFRKVRYTGLRGASTVKTSRGVAGPLKRNTFRKKDPHRKKIRFVRGN